MTEHALVDLVNSHVRILIIVAVGESNAIVSGQFVDAAHKTVQNASVKYIIL